MLEANPTIAAMPAHRHHVAPAGPLSLLRMGFGARLLGAVGLAGAIWLAVLWAVG